MEKKKDKGYKKAGEVVTGGIGYFDGKAFRRNMLQRLADDMKEDIIPIQDLQKRSRELNGGKCPKCEKPWERIIVNGILMKTPFEYYQAGCRCEATEREIIEKERVIVSRLRQAGVKGSYLKVSFDDWDNTVEHDLTVSMSEVRKHFFKGMFKKGIGLVLTGSVGTGKTFCAVAVLRAAAKYTDSILFVSMAEYIPMILDESTGQKTIERMKSVRLMIMDDLEKVSTSSEWVKGRIFEIVEMRTASGLPVIVTTNCEDLNEFERKFGSPLTDRLFGFCVPVHFSGKSYRKLRRLRQAEIERAKELQKTEQGELII